jgi:hypothetical protein
MSGLHITTLSREKSRHASQQEVTTHVRSIATGVDAPAGALE